MKETTQANRNRLARRKRRGRSNLSGTGERPRLCVVRTLKHVYAQLIDDTTGTTLVAASTLSPEVRKEVERSWNAAAAVAVGTLIASKAKAKGLSAVVFDRGGRKYHGRVKALAEAARKGGLAF